MKAIGDKGEEQALKYLQNKGFSLVARNVRYPFGELDLVMKDSHTLVFIEVRLRKNTQYGSPLETVNNIKQGRIIKAAQAFLQDAKSKDPQCRFDVVAITPNSIEHVEDAFWLP